MKIDVRSKSRTDLINITAEIEKNVKIKEGVIVVYSPHTTCGIFVNENEPELLKDIKNFLEKTVPAGKWAHDYQEGNADSHLKGILLGHSAVIPVENGKLQLGTWQSVFFAELDGPRTREIIIKEIKS